MLFLNKYCVIKDTAKLISQGKRDDLLILSGESTFNKDGSKVDFEILTEIEYQDRKALEPIPLKPLTTEERLQVAEDTINFLLGL